MANQFHYEQVGPSTVGQIFLAKMFRTGKPTQTTFLCPHYLCIGKANYSSLQYHMILQKSF